MSIVAPLRACWRTHLEIGLRHDRLVLEANEHVAEFEAGPVGQRPLDDRFDHVAVVDREGQPDVLGEREDVRLALAPASRAALGRTFASVGRWR